MSEAISVKGLTKSYQGRTVLNHLDLSVKTGTVFGLLGANGAGKSTAIECMLGSRKADSGEVFLLGRDPKRNRRELFQRIGVQFQEGNCQQEIKAYELCEEAACLYRNPADRKALCGKFAIDAIAAGREGATSLHRYVHPGQSLTIARNLRHYTEFNKEELVLGTDCFDKPQRQTVQHDKKKALTMHDDRLVFTEEMMKKEASRCLGCGVSVVDQNKCIGCGLCTTKCEFDAIHLSRDFPENSTLVNIDKMYMPVAEYAVKRAARIAIRSIKEKVSTYKE